MDSTVKFNLDLDVHGDKGISSILNKINDLDKQVSNKAVKNTNKWASELAAIGKALGGIDTSKLGSIKIDESAKKKLTQIISQVDILEQKLASSGDKGAKKLEEKLLSVKGALAKIIDTSKLGSIKIDESSKKKLTQIISQVDILEQKLASSGDKGAKKLEEKLLSVKGALAKIIDTSKLGSIKIDESSKKKLTQIISQVDILEQKLASSGDKGAKKLEEKLLSVKGALAKIDVSKIGNNIALPTGPIDGVIKKLDTLRGNISGNSKEAENLRKQIGEISNIVGKVKPSTKGGAINIADGNKHKSKAITQIDALQKKLGNDRTVKSQKLRNELVDIGKAIGNIDVSRIAELNLRVKGKEDLASVSSKIDEITKRLASDTSATATKLRNKLDEISKSLTSIDLSKVGDLDAVDSSIAKITSALSGLNDVQAEIGNSGSANAKIVNNELQAITDTLSKIDLSKLGELTITVENEDAIDQINEQVDILQKKLEKDTTNSAKALKKELAAISNYITRLDLSKLDTRDSLRAIIERVNSISKGLDKVDNSSHKINDKFSLLDVYSKAVEGDFAGIVHSITNAIEKSKAWQRLTARVGETASLIKLGVIAQGLNSIIGVAKRWLSLQQDINREAEKNANLYAKQGAQMVESSFNMKEKVREREKLRHDNAIQTEQAIRSNVNLISKTEISTASNLRTLNNPYERENEDIELEARRKQDDIDIAEEARVMEEKRNAARFELNQEQERKRDVEIAIKRLRGYSKNSFDRLASISDKGVEFEWLKNLADNVGVGSYREDAVQNMKDATEVAEFVSDMLREFTEKQKDIDIALEEKRNSIKVVDSEYYEMAKRHSAISVQREKEDEGRGRGRSQADYENDYKYSEEARRNKLADDEARDSELDSIATYAEKKEILARKEQRLEKQMLAERQKLAKALKKLNVESIEDVYLLRDSKHKQMAQDAHTNIEEMKAMARQLRREKFDLSRQGASGEYGNARSLRVEKRDREEKDRNQLNAWIEKIGGPLAGAGIAQNTLQLRETQMAKVKGEAKTLANEVQARLVEEGQIKKGQRINLNDYAIQQKMTAEELSRYQNIKSDMVTAEDNLRDARYGKMGVDYDRQQRMAEFREEAMRQGNRLTAMGLGGDVGAAGFAKSTAGNTKELVTLTKEMLKTFRGGRDGRRIMNRNTWTY